MPKPQKPQYPAYCLHRASGKAVVRLNGRDVYLGPYNTEESRARYDAALAEWLAGGRRLPDPEAPPLTINELILAYMRHAEQHFGARRTSRSELSRIKCALRPVKRLFGFEPATSFGPKRLSIVRQAYIDECGGKMRRIGREPAPQAPPEGDDQPAGTTPTKPAIPKSTKTVNENVRIVRAMFKWAVSQEIVPASAHHGLCTLSGLQAGQSAARESEKVSPVPAAFIDAVLPKVQPQVKALIELQLATGARPGELVIMRVGEIDTSGPIWIYRPSFHKNRHRGLRREIALGPKAQEIIRPFLKPSMEAYIFSPAEAEATRAAARRKKRKTPLYAAHLRHMARKRRTNPKRTAQDHYSVGAYRRAVQRACVKAGIPEWAVHQLRHNRGTEVAKRYGIEAARVVLGHQHIDTTELYAERDSAIAVNIARETG